MSAVVDHYKANLRDLHFNLFEFLKVHETTLGQGKFDHMDREDAEGIIAAVEELATGPYAAGFMQADHDDLSFDRETCSVTLPQGVKDALAAYWDNEWHKMTSPQEIGGIGAPPSLNWACFEMLAGGHASAAFYVLGEVNAQVIHKLGTPKQKELFTDNILERKWGGTMMLTEPDAGSDVGAGSARARHIDGEIWELEGNKRYITNGDFDCTENIIHLVLARRDGGEVGTKGLSMFIVPKFWVNDDGSLGERNGVFATKVEGKMGLKGSATCEMTLGGDVPCRGWLVGDVHKGIKQMFQVIEHARMAVGIKSLATLSTAYLNALQYANERIQGPDLKQAADKTSPRVAIIRHPDVRFQLMKIKAHVEGMRALALYNAQIQDRVELAGGHGTDDAKALDRRNDLLLPLIKGYCSEKCYELLSVALQIYGGGGYIKDYPLEQYVRDQKIDTLYEGTTHIQALDLIFRKVFRDQGQTLGALAEEMQATVESGEGGEATAAMRERLARALGDIQGIFGAIMTHAGDDLYHVGLQANRVLFALAEIVIAWLLIKQAAVAATALEAGPAKSDVPFYTGKIAAAQWFADNVLPGLTLTRKLVEASTTDLMTMDDACF